MLNNILMPKNQFALADPNALNLKSFDYTTFNKAKDTFSLAENIDRSNQYSPPTLALRYRGDEIIGRSILRTSEDVLEVTNAKIVLKKDGEGSYIRKGSP
ncbi:hypothetical protein AWW70_16725 [Bacillus mycoides]|uniref:Uncharacterized protein n=1 Tax=Bacillus mycoides TaxID=1405 RepID=A0A120EFQ4_BACMY|nr:hypothetical protein AWW70_16725 [Bacillus mycoides]